MSDDDRLLDRDYLAREQPCYHRTYVSDYSEAEIIQRLKTRNIHDGIEYALLDSPLRLCFKREIDLRRGFSMDLKPEYALCILEKEKTIISLVWIESRIHRPIKCSQMDNFIKSKLSATIA